MGEGPPIAPPLSSTSLPYLLPAHGRVAGRAGGREAKFPLHWCHCGSLLANAILPAVMASFQMFAL